ncbi:71_t:CDS:2 [Funneliformis geosporum]|nr:71_t:CDS:2 [Funneliformis geosporum]
MPQNKREQKTKQRGRSSSLLQTNKKQNTNKTLDIPPVQSTSETVVPVVTMEVDPTSSIKGKEKDTPKETPKKTDAPFDDLIQVF